MLIGCKAKFIACSSGSNNDNNWLRVLIEDPNDITSRINLYADASLTNRFKNVACGDQVTLYLNMYEGRSGLRVIVTDLK